VTEQYTETALHFEASRLPRLLEQFLSRGPLAFADLGCGDGPLFPALERAGFIAPTRPVYAIDLDPKRLARVSNRFPWIETVAGPADSVPEIADGALDFVCSTMVLEHVPDERADLAAFVRLLTEGDRFRVLALERNRLWFPLLDPVLFRIGHRYRRLAERRSLLRVLRALRVPIPG